jgi:hypothetical protein
MSARGPLARLALLLVATLGLCSGCMHSREEENKAASWGVRRPPLPLSGVEGTDAITMAVSVIEVPLTDSYVGQELWSMVDEQALPLESKANLAANGLRAGLLGGHPPSDFLALLTSEKTSVAPRQVQTRLGQPYSPFPALKHETLRFTLRDGDQSESVEFAKAQCQWEVTCKPGEEKKLSVKVVPVLRHGEMLFEPQSVTDAEGVMSWQLTQRQEQEKYEGLAVEVDLAPSEYLVIGCSNKPVDGLGLSWLTQIDTERPVRRLLVIRVARTGQALKAPAPDAPKPLALQAQEQSLAQ